jgi:asparagine synthase (glutamine-hydrolysing)
MCGIAGIYDKDGAPVEQAALERMAGAIRHRGPDGDGFYYGEGVGLAHLALRIIDLSDAARQPMSNEDGRLRLIFNGEIYNYRELRPDLEARGHRFRSQSDSENILHAYEEWGPGCLGRFNGMWAFALWDEGTRRLFLARDRLGIKPLYYWWDGQQLIFGSEIKALLAHPAVAVEPNGAAIAQYFQAMHLGGDHTWFQGIHRLLPGHYLTVDASGLHIRRYWDLPAAEDPPGVRSEADYIAEVRALLADAVRIHLRSDVPVGAHLSGGVDSSAVVALISRQLDGPVRTFSGAFGEGPAYDERPYIQAVVDRYRTDHHEVVPTWEDLPAVLPRLVWHLDEPVVGAGAFPQYFVCKITRAAGVIVVNGGQGGDELFGGYYGYIPAYLRSLAQALRRRPAPGRAAALVADGARVLLDPTLRPVALTALRSGRRGRLQTGDGAALPAFFGPTLRILDFASSILESADPTTDNPKSKIQNPKSPLGAALAYDLRHYLPGLLHVEDRTSMAWGLESRVPLLDYRLVELAMRIPAPLKLRGLETKRILRRAVADLLPPAVAARRDKKGFPTPIDRWFAGPLAGWLEGQLLGPEAQARGLFDPPYVRRALAEHRAGADRSRDLWMLLNTHQWWRLFVEKQDADYTAQNLLIAHQR